MMTVQISKYQESMDKGRACMESISREELVLEWSPLVKYIANRIAVRLPPSVSKDEMISAGIIGLYDAIDKFDSKKGFKFQTYAEHRIKGAMLDELRKLGWASRSVMNDVHKIENATSSLIRKLGREPEDVEIAEEIGVDIDCYHRMMRKAQGVSLLNFDEIITNGNIADTAEGPMESASSLKELEVKELKELISNAISELTEKEQVVISLYYYEELTLKEIGKILELTESRVSQIHTKIIMKLRIKLKSYYVNS